MPTRLKHYNPAAADMKNRWRVLDAEGQTLGRFASEVAKALIGKDRPEYVPHMTAGDFVVVVNASKIVVTGNKAEDKIYRRHSQRPGGLKEIPYHRMMERTPERIVELAVRGMLPKNRLGRKMYSRLKVYAGPEHPHMAQVIGSERAEMREESE